MSQLTAADGNLRRYLTVVVAGEVVAIDIAQIREVIHCPRMTSIPLSPPVVPAVINLRGAVVPVVDLAVRLGRASTQVGKRSCIVVVEVRMEEGVRPIGLLVDAVVEAVEATDEMLEPRPAFGVDYRHDFQAAMLRLSGRFVTALDLAAVADASQLEQLVSEHAQGLGQRQAPGAS